MPTIKFSVNIPVKCIAIVTNEEVEKIREGGEEEFFKLHRQIFIDEKEIIKDLSMGLYPADCFSDDLTGETIYME